MEITIEKLETMLQEHKAAVQKEIDAKVSQQTDKANAEVKGLQEQLAKVNETLKAFAEQKKSGFGLPGVTEEKEQFSIGSFFKAMLLASAGGKGSIPYSSDPWKDSGAEFEKRCCQDYMKKRAADFVEAMGIVRTAATAADGSNMGFLIPPEFTQEIIDLALPNMPILNMPGVTKLNGLFGDLPVPRVTSRPTGYHVGENVKPTESQGALALEWLRPKKCGAFTKQSNRLLWQSRGVADTLIKQLLAEAVALEQHSKLCTGTGSENQPLGVFNQTGMTSTIAGTSIDLAGAQWKFDDLVAMVQALAAANELSDTPTYGFLTHPNIAFGLARQYTKMYSTQSRKDGLPVSFGALSIAGGNPVQSLANAIGYPIKHSTHVPNTDTYASRSTSSRALFGNWSKYWYATWRDPIFRVSDVASDGSTGSAFLDDMLYMVMFLEYDAKIMRPSAFALQKGLESDPSKY